MPAVAEVDDETRSRSQMMSRHQFSVGKGEHQEEARQDAEIGTNGHEGHAERPVGASDSCAA